MKIPDVVIKAYNLDVNRISKIEIGLINETFKAETDRGVFILQKQHPVFNEGTVEKIDVVSSHLESKGIVAQRVVKTEGGELCVKDENDIWRLLTYIPGEVTEIVDSPTIAYEAGKLIGRFHKAASDLNLTVGLERPLHNTEDLFKKFKLIRMQIVRGEAKEFAELVYNELPKLILDEKLRKIVVHGDPKISNVIFDSNKKGVALIDLDSCQVHTPLVELGDAFRSWCGKLEDDPNNTFNMEYYHAGMKGYEEASEDFLLEEEKALIPQGIKLITLELASRFLVDYVENKYFGWDKKRYESRKEHNLARAKGQIALYRSLESQLK